MGLNLHEKLSLIYESNYNRWLKLTGYLWGRYENKLHFHLLCFPETASDDVECDFFFFHSLFKLHVAEMSDGIWFSSQMYAMSSFFVGWHEVFVSSAVGLRRQDKWEGCTSANHGGKVTVTDCVHLCEFLLITPSIICHITLHENVKRAVLSEMCAANTFDHHLMCGLYSTLYVKPMGSQPAARLLEVKQMTHYNSAAAAIFLKVIFNQFWLTVEVWQVRKNIQINNNNNNKKICIFFVVVVFLMHNA